MFNVPRAQVNDTEEKLIIISRQTIPKIRLFSDLGSAKPPGKLISRQDAEGNDQRDHSEEAGGALGDGHSWRQGPGSHSQVGQNKGDFNCMF